MSSTVVIVGGGYAGTMVAKALDDRADVILVDPRDAFVNVSGSLRATARLDWADQPFFDYGPLLTRGRVIRDSVVAVQPGGVTLADGCRVDADHIVLATGSSHSYPARPRTTATSAAAAADDLRATNEQLSRADRVLVLGAGPVGLELAGEIRDAWPGKRITILDPSPEILPACLPEVRDELRRQLEELDIDLRLATSLADLPHAAAATASTFTVTTTDGEEITADIWFRTFGSRPHTAYLADGALVRLTERQTVPVDEHLNVIGHPTVYALGDIADLADPKMATQAMTQAPTVIENIAARLRGEQPVAVHEPATTHRILVPLGTRYGVGQLTSPDGGAIAAPVDVVVARKGTDLFTARFAERFGRTATAGIDSTGTAGDGEGSG
ncbi:NAD(P)/FAD-dependent oxidoreductase [Pseudonocardia sp. ICBG601]|uniref:NAD(P)/FAD-dependent oxidoreductase n=1 Tax=Pseudonocardia sp. ICBG601 TaxID=2846759 RepID=UPI001CF6A216|nr:FAD-dependent oxidoreductase [Pseudonocardia sp. ICBG601]